MSTYKMSKRPIWTSLLVMIHLLAVLLPVSAQPVSAQVKICGEASAQAANASPMAVVASDQEMTIPKEKVDLAVYTANWTHKLEESQKVENLLYKLMTEDGAEYINEIELTEYLGAWLRQYEPALKVIREKAGGSSLELNDLVIETMLNHALNIPQLAPIVPRVWLELTVTQHWSDNLGLDLEHQIMAGAERYNLSANLLRLSPEILARAYECSRNFPGLADVFKQIDSEQRINHILDSADKILEDNPDLPIPTEIRGRIEEDGTLVISLDELKALSKDEFNNIHETIDAMQETLIEIDQKQDVIIDYLKDMELRAKHQAMAKKKAEEAQLKIDAAKASLTIITAIAGQIDPKVAKQINVYGTAAIQVAQGLKGWVNAVSGLKTLDKIASLSTVVLTGNIIGAFMNIVAGVSEAQPTPEQLILEEIGKLREQVNEIRTEMHDRFDRIDQGLNAIYTTMHERFDQIDIQLGKINGNISELQESLLFLDLQLSRIERNNFEFLNALGRRPLLEAINGGLGYQERTGVPMPYQPDFIAFENTLHSWATIHAFDPVNAGPTQRDYSDSQILAELSAYPLDSNLNYLNGWIKAHGLPPISNKPLPSPRDWLFASRAYTQLGIEWPEHMKKFDTQRHAELEQIGIELEAAMRNISTQLTGDGPQGNSLLFSTVITHYQSKVDALDNAIQSLENAFLNEVRVDQLQRSEPFDLYGGIDQPLTYLAPEMTTATCGNLDGYGSYAAPSNLRSLIPNFNRYNLADYLRLGTLSVCISDLWYDLNEICTEYDPERPDVPPSCRYISARHISYVTILFDSVPIGRLSIDEGELPIPPTGPDEKFTRNYWNIYKGMFEALTALDSPTSEIVAQRAAVTAKVEEALGNYQQALYGRVINEMTQGGLKSLVTELAGSKALLEAFTTLGLPRAIEQDEFLHALLYGDQQLVDDNQIMNSYGLRLTQPITGTDLLVNPRMIMQQADERLEVFQELAGEYLAAITAQTHVEAPDYIASIRRMFDLTMSIVRIELPQVPDEEPQEPDEVAITGLQAFSDAPTLLGNATNFTASVTAGTNVAFAWDFGDGSTASGANATHTFAEPGSYKVRVTASNSLGQQSVTEIVQVHAPNPDEVPVAGLTASHDGPTALGEVTTFTASLGAGSNVAFAWDFGDQNVGIGANVTHTYAEPGTYLVKVTASNSVSKVSKELQVVVEPLGSGQSTQYIHMPLIQR